MKILNTIYQHTKCSTRTQELNIGHVKIEFCGACDKVLGIYIKHKGLTYFRIYSPKAKYLKEVQ